MPRCSRSAVFTSGSIQRTRNTNYGGTRKPNGDLTLQVRQLLTQTHLVPYRTEKLHEVYTRTAPNTAWNMTYRLECIVSTYDCGQGHRVNCIFSDPLGIWLISRNWERSKWKAYKLGYRRVNNLRREKWLPAGESTKFKFKLTK